MLCKNVNDMLVNHTSKESRIYILKHNKKRLPNLKNKRWVYVNIVDTKSLIF